MIQSRFFFREMINIINRILSIDPKGNLVVINKNGLVQSNLNINTITEADQIEVFGDVILEVKTKENDIMKQDNKLVIQ